jgi:MerR family transcriptional regulator, light-induced transcriptional regulator
MKLQEAADRLGVHYQTAYRWVREGRLASVKVQSSYEVSEEELERFLARRAIPTAAPERIVVRGWEQHRQRLFDAFVAGDEVEARGVVDRFSELGVPLLELCDELLAPALRRIGDNWHSGSLSIAEEHRATAIAERLLARISTNPRGRPRGTAVVLAAPGDRHSFPGAMAALVLRDDRWKVHHLGADVPPHDLVLFAATVNADLVVMSITVPAEVAVASLYNGMHDLGGLVERLEQAGHKVLLGGPGRKLTELVDLAKAL